MEEFVPVQQMVRCQCGHYNQPILTRVNGLILLVLDCRNEQCQMQMIMTVEERKQ
jgi:hypothetical protein